MVNKIFASVANVLKRVSKGTGLSYNELNVVVYYFIIPLTWCFLLDKIFGQHYLTMAGLMFGLGVFVGCENFRMFSDDLFYKSVRFLNRFNSFGSNYIVTSVWICVVIPLFIYVLLFTIVLL